MTDTWVIVGASRGIGLEFVRQLLQNGHHVIAGVRNVSMAEQLFDLKSRFATPELCRIEECDITDDGSIQVSPSRSGRWCSGILRMIEIRRKGPGRYPRWIENQEYCAQRWHPPLPQPRN